MNVLADDNKSDVERRLFLSHLSSINPNTTISVANHLSHIFVKVNCQVYHVFVGNVLLTLQS